MLDRPTITEPTLDDALRRIQDLQERVDALERERVVDGADELLSTFQVGELTGRTRQCVVNWIEQYQIGHFDGRRWLISRAKLINHCRAHPGASRRAFWRD